MCLTKYERMLPPLRVRSFSPLVASPVFGEPTLAVRKVRDDPLEAPPESRAVVGFYEVDQLVDDHVLNETLGDLSAVQPVAPLAHRAPMGAHLRWGALRTL